MSLRPIQKYYELEILHIFGTKSFKPGINFILMEALKSCQPHVKGSAVTWGSGQGRADDSEEKTSRISSWEGEDKGTSWPLKWPFNEVKQASNAFHVPGPLSH